MIAVENKCQIKNSENSLEEKFAPKKYVNSQQNNVNHFVCSICNYTSEKRKYFNRHLKTVHEQNKSFKCEICQRCLRHKASLNKQQELYMRIPDHSIVTFAIHVSDIEVI